jgi:hypothetical protein
VSHECFTDFVLEQVRRTARGAKLAQLAAETQPNRHGQTIQDAARSAIQSGLEGLHCHASGPPWDRQPKERAQDAAAGMRPETRWSITTDRWSLTPCTSTRAKISSRNSIGVKAAPRECPRLAQCRVRASSPPSNSQGKMVLGIVAGLCMTQRALSTEQEAEAARPAVLSADGTADSREQRRRGELERNQNPLTTWMLVDIAAITFRARSDLPGRGQALIRNVADARLAISGRPLNDFEKCTRPAGSALFAVPSGEARDVGHAVSY